MSDTTPPTLDLASLVAMVQDLSSQIKKLEEAADSRIRPGQVVYKRERATTLLRYPALQEQYPAITQTDFFNTILPPGHGHFHWSDYHYTEGMDYKPPPVLEHPVVTLPQLARRHELDLIKAQGFIANTTRMYDILAHQIVSSDAVGTSLGQTMLSFLNTARILASNDASKLSHMRKDIYLRHLDLTTTEPQKNALLTLDDLVKRRARADLITITYSKPSDRKTAAKPCRRNSSPGRPPQREGRTGEHLTVQQESRPTAETMTLGTAADSKPENRPRATATGQRDARETDPTRSASRSTPSPVQTGIGPHDGLSLGQQHCQQGMPDRPQQTTAIVPPPHSRPLHYTNGERIPFFVTEKGYRRLLRLGVIQPTVHHAEENKGSPSFSLPLTSQPVPEDSTFQNGNTHSHLPDVAGNGLDDLNRL